MQDQVNSQTPSPTVHPLQPAQNPGYRRGLSLALFVAGILCPPIVFIASGLVAGPDWKGTSALLDAVAIPLVCLGAILCFAAPFLLPATLRRRVLLAFAALIAFLIIGGVVGYICLIRFGVPIR
jgi:hypothetical protein